MKISNFRKIINDNYMGGEVIDFSRSESTKEVESTDHLFIPKDFIPEGLGDYTEEHRLELSGKAKLEDFLSDDEYEVLFSGNFEKDLVFNAFYALLEEAKIVEIKFDKNNNKIYSSDIEDLYRHILCLYNDTFEDVEKLGALSYLKGIVNVMNYLSVEQLMDLSIHQITEIAEQKDARSVRETYNNIINKRHVLNKDDFKLYVNMLEDKHNYENMRTAKKMYEYISLMYNSNTTLQNNISYENYLNKMSEYSDRSIFKMRAMDIIRLFGLSDTNFEIAKDTSEEFSDSEGFGYCTI